METHARHGERDAASGSSAEPFLPAMRMLVEAFIAFNERSDRHIRSMGLTTPQFDVIATLGNTTGMTCTELAEKTLVTKGTLTGVIDRLEKKELCRRIPSTQDRRSITIRLTSKGDKVFAETFPAQISFLKPYFERALNARELQTLAKLLGKLRQSLRGE